MQQQQYIDSNKKQEIIQRLKLIYENDKCFDCEQKNTKWSSISLGLFLCIDCAAKHRSYGPTISFVRSLTLDEWTQKQICYLENGGNAKALEYFRKNGALLDNSRQLDYKSGIVKQYKDQLEKIVYNIQNKQNNIQEIQYQQDQVIQKTEKVEDKKQCEAFQNNLEVTKITQTQAQKVFFNNSTTKASSCGSISNVNGKKKIKAEQIEDIDFDKLNNNNTEFGKSNNQLINQNQSQLIEEKQEQQQIPQLIKQQSAKSKIEPNDALEKMKTQKNNIKAISSASLFANQNNKMEKLQINKFNGQKGISSKQYFKNDNDDDQDIDNNDSPIQGNNIVHDIINVASEKIINIKEKVSDYILNNWG